MKKKFRYSVNNKGLDDKQRQFYDKNGFIIIKNNVSKELLDDFSLYFDEVCAGRIQTTARIIKDPLLKKIETKRNNIILKLQDFLNDDFLFKYATHEPLINIVESIIGPNIVAVNSMLINKPPEVKLDISRYPIHQDLHYFPFRPINGTVASWTAIEDINKQNGCLFLFPGSHINEELYKHHHSKDFRNPLFHGVNSINNEEKFEITMQKGDTIFFHPLLLHGSGPNTTEGYSKAISCHFTSTNSYFIDVKDTSQEVIMKEMMQCMNGWVDDYMMIWKLKSRHIKGKIGRFLQISSHL